MNKKNISTIILCLSIFTSTYCQLWESYNTENSPLTHNSILALEEDDEGNIWIGYHKGFAILNNSEWEVYTIDNFPLHDSYGGKRVISFLLDDGETNWIGTAYGLIKWDDFQTTTYYNQINTNFEMVDESIIDMELDKNGDLWYATFLGVGKYTDSEWVDFGLDDECYSKSIANDLFMDDDDFFIGYGAASYGGLMEIQNLGCSDFTKNSNHPLNSNEKVFVCSINKDLEGRILLGGGTSTFSNDNAIGLTIFNENEWIVYNKYNSPLEGNWIDDIEIDYSGSIWLATDNGVAKLNSWGEWEIYNSSNTPMESNSINDILIDNDGSIWIATNEGLYQYFGNEIKTNITQLNVDLEVNIYPNPVTNNLLVKSNESLDLTLSDLTGRILHNTKLKKTYSLNIENLPEGIYFLKMTNQIGKTLTKRFIKCKS